MIFGIRKMEKEVDRIRRSMKIRTDGRNDGGKGSGNWGHAGRPGEVGGSKKGGGKHNRQKDKKGNFTSFSKKRKEAATMHSLTNDDVDFFYHNKIKGVRIVDEKGAHYEQICGSMEFVSLETGEVVDFKKGEKVKVILPNSMNPNYNITPEDRLAMKKGTEDLSKAFSATDPQQMDDKYREQTGKIWRGSTKNERKALYTYTTSMHRPINNALRKGDTDSDSVNELIDTITEKLDQSELQEDTMLYRGTSTDAAEKLFGLPPGYLDDDKHMDPSNISLVGRVGTDDGFMSTGLMKGKGMGGTVKIEIMAPKGTKGLYCEPFSMYGNGDAINWNGKKKQSSYSSEFEFLLQRGCTLQIVGHTYNGSIHHIQAVIVRQDYSQSEYTKKHGPVSTRPPKKTKKKKTA